MREVTRSPEQLQREIDEIGHAYEALERIIRRGQENGEFRPELDPQLAATVFYGALEEVLTGWVMGLLPDGDDEVAKAEQAVVSLLCDGLLAPR
ncbi:MAG: TetR/AcrR family transcriptional regulator C-terminal domain-containing protein [Gaiellaceae bacterium]